MRDPLAIVVTCANGEWAGTALDLSHAASLARLFDREAEEDGGSCGPHRVLTGDAALRAEARMKKGDSRA